MCVVLFTLDLLFVSTRVYCYIVTCPPYRRYHQDQQKLAAAAAERKERLSKWRDAAVVATGGKQANLVDGAAERFASKSGGGGGDVGAPLARRCGRDRMSAPPSFCSCSCDARRSSGFLSDGESESDRASRL